MTQEKIEEALKLLNEKTPALRQLGLEKLSTIKNDDQVMDVVIKTLRDEEKEVRSYAAEILGDCINRQALIALTNALEDEAWEVRKSALESFAKQKNPETVPFFIQALRDGEPQVRYTAAKGLKNFDSHSMIEPLFDALRDKRESVREEAKSTLLNFQSKVPAFLVAKYLLDYDKNVREVVVQFLSTRVEGNPLPHLEKACEDKEWEIRFLALQEVGKLIKEELQGDSRLTKLNLKYLEDENARVRYQAIENLKKLNSPEAIEPLGIIAREDEDSNNRLMATETMTSIRRAIRME